MVIEHLLVSRDAVIVPIVPVVFAFFRMRMVSSGDAEGREQKLILRW